MGWGGGRVCPTWAQLVLLPPLRGEGRLHRNTAEEADRQSLPLASFLLLWRGGKEGRRVAVSNRAPTISSGPVRQAFDPHFTGEVSFPRRLHEAVGVSASASGPVSP